MYRFFFFLQDYKICPGCEGCILGDVNTTDFSKDPDRFDGGGGRAEREREREKRKKVSCSVFLYASAIDPRWFCLMSTFFLGGGNQRDKQILISAKLRIIKDTLFPFLYFNLLKYILQSVFTFLI